MATYRNEFSNAAQIRISLFAICAITCVTTLRLSIAFGDNYEQVVAALEQQRRETAARELSELRARRETLEERVNYAKKVVLSSFHLSEQGAVPPGSKSAKTFQRWKQLRETTAQGLLGHRERFVGEIANGKALNFLLQECGPSAFEHSFYRKNINKEDHQLFREITETYKLSKQTTRHIIWTQGLVGPKLTGRLNQIPLDTRWPALLRRTEFQIHTKKIERLRDQVIEELTAGKPVSAKTADQLLDAVHDLMEQVRSTKQEEMRQVRGKTARSTDGWFRCNEAEKHVKMMVAGAYRFVEGYELEDVVLEPIKLDDGITIEALLAYMQEHNLTFAKADANGQVAYNLIFEMMVRYYVDMCALEASAKELDKLKTQEYELQQTALGNRLGGFEKGLLFIAAVDVAFNGKKRSD